MNKRNDSPISTHSLKKNKNKNEKKKFETKNYQTYLFISMNNLQE